MKFNMNFQLTAHWFLPANQTTAEMLESARLEFCSEYADADLQIFISSPTGLLFESSIDGFMLNLFQWAAWWLIRRHWGQPTNWSCTQHLLPPYVCLSKWIKLWRSTVNNLHFLISVKVLRGLLRSIFRVRNQPIEPGYVHSDEILRSIQCCIQCHVKIRGLTLKQIIYLMSGLAWV